MTTQTEPLTDAEIADLAPHERTRDDAAVYYKAAHIRRLIATIQHHRARAEQERDNARQEIATAILGINAPDLRSADPDRYAHSIMCDLARLIQAGEPLGDAAEAIRWREEANFWRHTAIVRQKERNELRAALSEMPALCGDMQDGDGNTPPVVERARNLIRDQQEASHD